MTIGQAVKALRKHQGLAQNKFGAQFNVTVMTVQRWEGDLSTPSPIYLVGLYNTARDHGRDELAGIFAGGKSNVAERRSLIALDALRFMELQQYFAAVQKNLNKATCDTSLSADEKRGLLIAATEAAVQGEAAIRRLSARS